jgi:hypothetical protein
MWRNRNSEATERTDREPIDNTHMSKYLTSMTLHRNTRIVHSPSSDTHAPETIQTQQQRENTCSRRPCTLLQQFKVPTDHQKLMRKIKTFYISSRKFSAHVSTYHALAHSDNDANASSRSYLAYAYIQLVFHQQVDKYSRGGLFSESRWHTYHVARSTKTAKNHPSLNPLITTSHHLSPHTKPATGEDKEECEDSCS